MKNILFTSGVLVLGSVLAHPHKDFRASLTHHARLPRRQATTTTRKPQYDFHDNTQDLFVSGNCTNNEIRQVINGWAEAGYLAEALTLWDPPNSDTYDDAMELYMGNNSDAFADRLVGNNARNYALHTGPQPSPNTHFWIYCNNPAPKERRQPCREDLFAFVWTQQGTVERNHYMVACPLYFDSEETPTLSQALTSVREGGSSMTNIESYTNNKGSVMLHEAVHWNTTVGQPMIFDYVPPNATKIYGAENVTKSAVYNTASGNSQIAEAYEVTSAAIFAMEIFGLDSPPVFVGESESKRKRQSGDDGEDDDDEDEEDSTEPPSGFVPPSNPNTPALDVTILDWDDSGEGDDQQSNVYAWYRVSGSMATIDQDDYLLEPSPISPNGTSTSTNSTSGSPSRNSGGSTGQQSGGPQRGSNGSPGSSPYGPGSGNRNSQTSWSSNGNRPTSSNGQTRPNAYGSSSAGATKPSGSSKNGNRQIGSNKNGTSPVSPKPPGTSNGSGSSPNNGQASTDSAAGTVCPVGYRPNSGIPYFI